MTTDGWSRRRVLVQGGLGAAGLIGASAAPLVWPTQALAIDWAALFGRAMDMEEPAGTLRYLRGHAFSGLRRLKQGDILQSGENLRVSRGGEAVVRLEDNGVLRVYGGSVIEVALMRMKEGFLRLITGAVQAVIPQGQPYLIAGVTATVGVKGTVVYREVFPPGERTGMTMDGPMAIPEGARDYFCNCFGTVDYAYDDDVEHPFHTSRSTYHDAFFLDPGRAKRDMLLKAPMFNHFDDDIRSLVAYQQAPRHRIDWLKH